jgi:hypothetical protein
VVFAYWTPSPTKRSLVGDRVLTEQIMPASYVGLEMSEIALTKLVSIYVRILLYDRILHH